MPWTNFGTSWVMKVVVKFHLNYVILKVILPHWEVGLKIDCISWNFKNVLGPICSRGSGITWRRCTLYRVPFLFNLLYFFFLILFMIFGFLFPLLTCSLCPVSNLSRSLCFSSLCFHGGVLFLDRLSDLYFCVFVYLLSSLGHTVLLEHSHR